MPIITPPHGYATNKRNDINRNPTESTQNPSQSAVKGMPASTKSFIPSEELMSSPISKKSINIHELIESQSAQSMPYLLKKTHQVLFSEASLTKNQRMTTILKSDSNTDSNPEIDPESTQNIQTSSQLVNALLRSEQAIEAESTSIKTTPTNPLLQIPENTIKPSKSRSHTSKLIGTLKKINPFTISYNMIIKTVTHLVCWKYGIKGLSGSDISNALVSMNQVYKHNTPQTIQLKSIQLNPQLTLSNIKLIFNKIHIDTDQQHLKIQTQLSADISYPNPNNPDEMITGTINIQPNEASFEFHSIQIIQSLLGSANILSTLTRFAGSAMFSQVKSIGSTVSSTFSQFTGWLAGQQSSTHASPENNISTVSKLLIPKNNTLSRVHINLAVHSGQNDQNKATIDLTADHIGYDLKQKNEKKLHIPNATIQGHITDINAFIPLKRLEETYPALKTLALKKSETKVSIQLKDIHQTSKQHTPLNHLLSNDVHHDDLSTCKCLSIKSIGIDLSGKFAFKKGSIQGVEVVSHANKSRSLQGIKVASFDLPGSTIQIQDLAIPEQIKGDMTGSDFSYMEISTPRKTREQPITKSAKKLEKDVNQEKKMASISLGKIDMKKVQYQMGSDETTASNQTVSIQAISGEKIQLISNTAHHMNQVTAEHIETQQIAQTIQTPEILQNRMKIEKIAADHISCQLTNGGQDIQTRTDHLQLDHLETPDVNIPTVKMQDISVTNNITSGESADTRITVMKGSHTSAQIKTKKTDHTPDSTSHIQLTQPTISFEKRKDHLDCQISCQEAKIDSSFDAQIFKKKLPAGLFETLTLMLTNNKAFKQFITLLAVKKKCQHIQLEQPNIQSQIAYQNAEKYINEQIQIHGVSSVLLDYDVMNNAMEAIKDPTSSISLQSQSPSIQLEFQASHLESGRITLPHNSLSAHNILEKLDVSADMHQANVTYTPEQKNIKIQAVDLNSLNLNTSSISEYKAFTLQPAISQKKMGSAEDIQVRISEKPDENEAVVKVKSIDIDSHCSIGLGRENIDIQSSLLTRDLQVDFSQTKDTDTSKMKEKNIFVQIPTCEAKASTTIGLATVGISVKTQNAVYAHQVKPKTEESPKKKKTYASAQSVELTHTSQSIDTADQQPQLKLSVKKPRLNISSSQGNTVTVYNFDRKNSTLQGTLNLKNSIMNSVDLQVDFTPETQTSDDTSLSGKLDLKISGNVGNICSQINKNKSKVLKLFEKIGSIFNFEIKVNKLPVQKNCVLLQDAIKSTTITLQCRQGHISWLLKPFVSLFNVSMELIARIASPFTSKSIYFITDFLNKQGVSSNHIEALEMSENQMSLEKMHLYFQINQTFPDNWSDKKFNILLFKALKNIYGTEKNNAEIEALMISLNCKTPHTIETLNEILKQLKILQKNHDSQA
ncbi:MAG: hypothetical protein HAW62_05325 [Endozoicomonadaceae bacterium]|nr:hypothetical protein [Endozoicomonadaceae bacterium]